MDSKRSRYLEAFKEGGNLIGLTSLVAASAALLSPLPLLAGLVVEAAYLLFVPDSHWYDVRLSRRSDAEVEERRQKLKAQTFTVLDADMQARFTRLEEIRSQINAQAQDDRKWFLTVLRKLDYLLEKFLLFAGKEAEFRRYIGSVWHDECGSRQRPVAHGSEEAFAPSAVRAAPMVTEVQASYKRDIEQAQALQAKETDANTKAVLDKRIQVLEQRSEGVGKIGRILTNLQYQLALLEDTFGLINDQIRARSPEQVLADIEGVVDQTDSMTQLLEELAPYEQAAA
jgi:ribosomal protein L9